MILLLTACLSSLLDSPYVLTTGLDHPVQLDAAVVDQTLVVTTAKGAFAVDGTGAVRPSPASPPRRAPTVAGAVLQAPTGALWVDAAGTLRLGDTVLIEGLESPRALTLDRDGRAYVVAGKDDPKLYRVEAGKLVLLAGLVGPVVDMAWGPGGALPERMLYLVREDGILEYLEPR